MQSLFSLQLDNEYFLNYIFPDIKIITKVSKIEDDNPVKHRKLIIYGDQGEGKSILIRSLVNEAIIKYGEDKINAVSSKNLTALEDLMLYGFDNKLIQIQVAEDITLEDISKETLRQYFRIRHIWKEQLKVDNGLIVSIFSLHRFHGGNKEIRSTAHSVVIRDDSLNPYDHSVIKNFVKEPGLEDLHLLEEYRESYPELKNYSIFSTRTKKVGLIFFPPIVKNNIKDISNDARKYSTFERLARRNEFYAS